MTSTNHYLAATLVVLFCLIKPSHQNTHYANSNSTIVLSSVQPCHLYGDADIYGIGIRLSFYIQWATIILALVAGQEGEIKTTRRGFNVVSLAVLINTLISATNGSFAILEMYIVSTLVIVLSAYFLIPFGGQLNFHTVRVVGERGGPELHFQPEEVPSIYELDALNADPIGIGILALIDAAFLFAQPWLYFVILRQGDKAGCSSKVFVFFTSVTLYSGQWVRFLKFVSIVSVIGGAFLLFFAFYAIAIIGIWKTKPQSKRQSDSETAGQQTIPSRPRLRGVFSGKMWHLPGMGSLKRAIKRIPGHNTLHNMGVFLHKARKNTLRLATALFGASFIAFVEKTIQINDIDLSSAPLTATSQLLPFLVGLFSAVSLLWVSVRKLRKEGSVVAEVYEDRYLSRKAGNELFELTRSLRESDGRTV